MLDDRNTTYAMCPAFCRYLDTGECDAFAKKCVCDETHTGYDCMQSKALLLTFESGRAISEEELFADFDVIRLKDRFVDYSDAESFTKSWETCQFTHFLSGIFINTYSTIVLYLDDPSAQGPLDAMSGTWLMKGLYDWANTDGVSSYSQTFYGMSWSNLWVEQFLDGQAIVGKRVMMIGFLDSSNYISALNTYGIGMVMIDSSTSEGRYSVFQVRDVYVEHGVIYSTMLGLNTYRGIQQQCRYCQTRHLLHTTVLTISYTITRGWLGVVV